MNPLTEILNDLRTRRLWPVMLVLVVGLVAVPVLLAKSSHAPTPTASAPVPSSPAPSLPTVSAVSTPSHTHLSGRGRDPFGGNGSGSGDFGPVCHELSAGKGAPASRQALGS